MAKKLERMLVGAALIPTLALGGCAGYNVRVNNVDLNNKQYADAQNVATDASVVEKKSYCAEHPYVCIIGGALIIGGIGYAIYDNNRGDSSNHSSSGGSSGGGSGGGTI